MFERLQSLIRSLSPGAAARPAFTFDDADHRLAAAGLMVHAMNVDGVQSRAELQRLRTLLQERFSLDEAETTALIAAADRRNKEAVDLDGFVAVVRRAYNAEGRRRIIEMMWDIVFADGVLHEFEDNIVWRVAEMLAIPPQERDRIRRKIALERGIAVPETGE